MFTGYVRDVGLSFKTDNTVFSPSAIDDGTLAMLLVTEFNQNDKVLDLGCGYGVVGIYASKVIGSDRVVMCDVSEDAVKYARINAELNGIAGLDIRLSNGYDEIPENDFTLILSNPPYHTDFSVAKRFIEGGFKRLVFGGKMIMVTKRLDWYKNKLTSVFGGVRVETLNGYFVFVAEKRENVTNKRNKPDNKLSKKLQRKYKSVQK